MKEKELHHGKYGTNDQLTTVKLCYTSENSWAADAESSNPTLKRSEDHLLMKQHIGPFPV